MTTFLICHFRRISGIEQLSGMLHVKLCMMLFIQSLPWILCGNTQEPCKYLGFVWTNCQGDKNPYVITFPANFKTPSLGQTCWTCRLCKLTKCPLLISRLFPSTQRAFFDQTNFNSEIFSKT